MSGRVLVVDDELEMQRALRTGLRYHDFEVHAVGSGEEAVRDYIVQNRRQHTVHQRIRDVSMRVNPLSLDELHDVTDIWAEHAMRLAEPDLRNMERLASAQLRRVKRLHP